MDAKVVIGVGLIVGGGALAIAGIRKLQALACFNPFGTAVLGMSLIGGGIYLFQQLKSESSEAASVDVKERISAVLEENAEWEAEWQESLFESESDALAEAEWCDFCSESLSDGNYDDLRIMRAESATEIPAKACDMCAEGWSMDLDTEFFGAEVMNMEGSDSDKESALSWVRSKLG